MMLYRDILLDEDAFKDASDAMAKLKTDTEALKERMKTMYSELKKAMDTPAGDAVEFVSEKSLIKPIEDMLLVIGHISSTLTEIKGSPYYKDVFKKYEELNSNAKLNS